MDRRLRKNIFSLLLLQKANYILPFITIPYLTRILGPDQFGRMSFVLAVINYFLLATDYGFNLSATQQISINRNEQPLVNKIFWITTFSKALLALAGLIILFVLTAIVPFFRADTLLYLAAFSIVLQSIFSPVWFLQGIEKPDLIIPISVVPKIISLLLVFVFVKGKDDLLAAIIIQCIVSFLLGTLICIWIFYKSKFVQWYSPKFFEIKEALYSGWHLFLSTAAISLYTTSTTVLLGLLTNHQNVGYFSAADKLVKGMQTLIVTIGQAAYPRINSYLQQSKEKAISFLWTCFKWMSAISIAASICLFLGAGIIVNILFGLPEYQPSVTLIQIMSFTPFIVSSGFVFGILGLLTFGFKKTYARIYVITGIFSLGLTVPLSYYFNVQGVAFAIVITETFISLIMFLQLKKNGIYQTATALA